MDPYLEHPALWPDVHSRLISAIADALVPLVSPKYFVGVEQRTHFISSEDLDAGVQPPKRFPSRPDVVLAQEPTRSLKLGEAAIAYEAASSPREIEVDLPPFEVTESYLEIRSLPARRVVTTIELLSPTNKQAPSGRAEYLTKRSALLESKIHLVEIDLLRAGQPMPEVPDANNSDYRLFISRWQQRPRARLIVFDTPHAIPAIEIPLLPEDPEPKLALSQVLHALYERARYDLWNDYTTPATPPIRAQFADWARSRIEQSISR